MENISRLACDGLEDNRLASYTEKSSRYQVIDAGSFYIPPELEAYPAQRAEYADACRGLFDAYQRLLDGVMAYLRGALAPKDGEGDGAYRLRRRRLATDAVRRRAAGGYADECGSHRQRADAGVRHQQAAVVGAGGGTGDWGGAAGTGAADCAHAGEVRRL